MAELTRGLHDIVSGAMGSGVSSDAGSDLTEYVSGKTYTNEGATEIAAFVLPIAKAGLTYRFIVQDADGIRVTAATGNTIRDGASVSGAAGKIESTTVGSTIELVAINATEWIVMSKSGTWTVT